MKELIKHLWENNKQEIVSKSLLNCHCFGVHSIMLLESPGKTIRLYVSMHDNGLWKNFPREVNTQYMSVGFHPHHCNLTLHCIKGVLLNWVVEESGDPSSLRYAFTKYKYKSQISDGEMAFEPLGMSYLKTVQERHIFQGESVSMNASEIHTVACYSNVLSAWLVYEGTEDPNYQPFCWSNADLNNIKNDDLYKKPTEQDVEELLILLELI